MPPPEPSAREARLAIVYQHMSPTRVPVFDALHDLLGDRLRVFYPAVLEGDRDPKWSGAPPRHSHVLLRRRSVAYELHSMKRYVHFNPDVWGALKAFDPHCVAIWNFNPTMLAAWAFARIRRRRFIVGTDGCLRSDRFNTPLHTWVRKLVIPTAHAAIGTSANSRDLFVRFGLPPEAYFNCWLVTETERFAAARGRPKEYDLLFSGQFIDRKLPHFFVDVVERVRERAPDVSVLLLGGGPLLAEVRRRLDGLGVRYAAPGFLGREQLPGAYASARILLYPTRLDAYGVITHEALAAGLPVVTNDEPGAVGEAVLDGETGFVRPLDPGVWAETVLGLLHNPRLFARIVDRGAEHVQRYTPANAAEGVRRALEYAMAGPGTRAA